jgi:hypothetical protein
VVAEVPARRETERGLAFDLQLNRVDVGLVGMALGADPIVIDGVVEAGLTDLAIGYGVLGTYNRGDMKYYEASHSLWTSVTEPTRPIVPLVVVAPMDTDVGRVRDAASSLDAERDLHPYGVWPRAIPEAVRQAVAGPGFDLRCDGHYDAIEDLPPAASTPSDPFRGSAPSWGDLDDRVGRTGAFGFRSKSVKILLNVSYHEWHVSGIDAPSWLDPTDPGNFQELSRYNVEDVGGCPAAPSAEEVRDVLDKNDTYIVHIGLPLAAPYHGYDITTARNWPIVSGTRSTWDPDGDGTREYYLVRTYAAIVYDDRYRRQLIEDVRDNLNDILQDIARKTAIATVKPIVLEDPHGFITGFDPPERPEARIGDQDVPFDLLLRGAVAPAEGDTGYFVEVGVLADEWQVARQEVLVVVPGWGRP